MLAVKKTITFLKAKVLFETILPNFNRFFFFSSFLADIIFIMSMVTSFGNLVYYGLQFNERKTISSVKWLLAFPMFAASVAARGFTLSVFLKETIQTGETIKSELIGALIVLTIYFGVNIALFKVCRQDLVRSFLFGLSSTLIPAGYNNDEYFYQCPNQPINDFEDKFETYGAQNSGLYFIFSC